MPVLLPGAAGAQIPYTNTSVGRPLTVEDAVTIERNALESFLSTAVFGRGEDGSTWSLAPGLAYGLLRRTEVELVVPVAGGQVAGRDRIGIAGVDLSLFHALNVESRSYPALALRGGVLMPVGDFGPQRAHEYITALATRSFGWGRLHFNHRYTFGNEPEGAVGNAQMPGGVRELSRWHTGLAVDRALPLRGLLLGAEAFARQGIGPGAVTVWAGSVGARYQFSTRTTVAAGVGTAFTAHEPTWTINVGVARTTALGDLMPGLGNWGR